LHLRVISCNILARSVYLCAARSPHVVDVELLHRGLHAEPLSLREQLQGAIDATGPEYDAVVLAYGLCGGATAGLKAAAIPLVLPRAHDCITLFLGNRAEYARRFAANPGTYWYVQDYVERDDEPTGWGLGAGSESESALEQRYALFVEKYGRDNADYLMETLGGWHSHYDHAAFVDMGVGDAEGAVAKARAEAERRGWAFERLAGDLVLVRRLLDGDWADDFLVVQPGEQVVMSYDEDVLGAVADASRIAGESSRDTEGREST
jgi:Protein of unknown function (DUF1638)